jgi:hypothetical protein
MSIARHPHTRRAFTLLEVMIAVAVLFMCLFAVLALLSNSLASARKLQTHRVIDTGTVAGLVYVQLLNTNTITEGPVELDLGDQFPGCKADVEILQKGTNGLCQINFFVERNQRLELKSGFLMYLPVMKVGIMNRNLPP